MKAKVKVDLETCFEEGKRSGFILNEISRANDSLRKRDMGGFRGSTQSIYYGTQNKKIRSLVDSIWAKLPGKRFEIPREVAYRIQLDLDKVSNAVRNYVGKVAARCNAVF